ncbi:MAG: hypothetical protein FJX75_07190 [Armatimonadetes bacterium]|nr:hypothetical protein [Armatimonadota bacterium]
MANTGPLVGVVVLLALVCATGATADPGWSRTLVEPDAKTGLPARIVGTPAKGGNLLVATATLTLSEGGKELPAVAFAKAGQAMWSAKATEGGFKVTLTYGTAATGFVELALANTSDKARSLACTLALPIRPEADRAFFPAGHDPRPALAVGAPAVTYGYQAGGIGTAMPLAQVYCEAGDWGLAAFGEIGALVEPMRVSVARTKQETRAEVTFDLPLPANGQATRRLYFAATRGDWRPALGAVLASFPAAFEPQNPDVTPLHGPFVCSGGTPPNEQIEDWYAQGCRAVEIHCTFPFYGEYVPTRDVWTPLVDDQWHSLKISVPADQRPPETASWQALRDFVEQRNPPTMTRAAVNDYIDRLHAHGMKGLIYFNPTEAWAPWAAATFPDDRYLGPGGKPLPAWLESSAMIPDKNRPWGKYLLEQVRGELEIYPKVDGVFFDQSAGGGHNLAELCAEACSIVRARKGVCWWNGPYNMELAALADGMMTEGGGTDTYRESTEIIQYYGLAGKPIISLGPANTAGYAEVLVHGVIPQPVSRAQTEMGERWFPLFGWLRNRSWVLEAHAFEAPPEVQANLFRVPGGNLVAPIVQDPAARSSRVLFDLPITVRAPEVRDTHAVYLLAPDLRGYHKLPFARDDGGSAKTAGTLRVTVPRLGPAALLVLAKTGVFAALDGGLHVVEGTQPTARLAFDNWTPKPVELVLRTDNAQKTQQLASGATITTECPIESVGGAGERVVLPSAAKLGGTEMGPTELWVDPALVLVPEAPAEMRDDETLVLRAKLLSHLPVATTVHLEAAGKGWQLDAPADFTANPDRAMEVQLRGRPSLAGETSISVKATAGEVAATATVPVRVMATALAPGGLEKVRAAELVLDVFGVDAGAYEHKPVSINGVEIGNLPQGSGDVWADGKTLPVPRAAMKALREQNDVAIDNQVGDAFKVRNLRLVLKLKGGITAVSGIDRGVYTGLRGWLHDEGKLFDSGQPLTGMRLTIPLDPNRRERYEEQFGTPMSGKLLIDINGSDGGIRAHKPVSINGCVIGDLPQAGDPWTPSELPLTPEALASLMARNEVTIENSEPADAFKVRNARIEIENTEGRKFVTGTETGAYTSVGWEFAEGTVGSPIRFELRFADQGP